MPDLSFSFPLLKAEKLADGRLLVEGIATSETPDRQNDVMDYAGSKAAFAKWRGNIREAHDPTKMVGKALDWWPIEEAKQIGVRAFISSGAPDTQAKVLDGTLSMFSVGGDARKTTFEKAGEKRVRRVVEWEMTELSLVDSGANPDAAFTIAKGDKASEVLAEEETSMSDDYGAAAEAVVIEKPAEEIEKREFSDEKREELAEKGQAMDDGSFPIKSREDIANAVKAVFRAKDVEAAKAHIIEQAKKLGAEDALPDGWLKKSDNRFARLLMEALEKAKPKVDMPDDIAKCNKAAAMGHLEKVRDTIEKGWLEDKIAEREEKEEKALDGVSLRKDGLFPAAYTPTITVDKMPEDDVQFALTILGCLRQASRWLDALIQAEDAEAHTESHGPTLDAAKAGVEAAVKGMAEFVGEEAQEIADGVEKASGPSVVFRGLVARVAALEAQTSAAGKANAEAVEKVAAGIKTITDALPQPEQVGMTKSDVAALADALGTVLGEEREKTSKVVGALLEKVESVGKSVADLLLKTATVGEGVERILKAPVPGGPARFDVRKAATMTYEGATSETGSEAEYAALLRAYDEATPARRPFIESQLLIAQAMRGQR